MPATRSVLQDLYSPCSTALSIEGPIYRNKLGVSWTISSLPLGSLTSTCTAAQDRSTNHLNFFQFIFCSWVVSELWKGDLAFAFLILRICFSHFCNWVERAWQEQWNLEALGWWCTVHVNTPLKAHPGCWSSSQHRTSRPFPLHSQFKATPPALNTSTTKRYVDWLSAWSAQHDSKHGILPPRYQRAQKHIMFAQFISWIAHCLGRKNILRVCRNRRRVISMHYSPSSDSYAIESGTI